MSPAIHAIIGSEVEDRERARQYFYRSAFVDLADNQSNTEDRIHIASVGGTWQVLVCGFGGFRVFHGRPTFTPWLPEKWQGINDEITVHGETVSLTANRTATVLLPTDLPRT